MRREPLLIRSSPEYYMPDDEYKAFTQSGHVLFKELTRPTPPEYLTFILAFLEKLCFIVAAQKLGQYSLIMANWSSFVMAICYTIQAYFQRRLDEEGGLFQHLWYFVVIGFLDATYLYMLFIGAGSVKPYAFVVLVNAPIAVNLICKALLQGRRFFVVQYVGAGFVVGGIVMQFLIARNGDLSYELVLLLSSIPMILSQSTKTALLRTSIYQMGTFNKYTSICTFIIGCVSFPIILAADKQFDTVGGGILDSLECLMCVSCGSTRWNLTILFVVGFLWFAILSNLFQVRSKESWNRLISATLVVNMMIAVVIGSFIAGYSLPSLLEIVAFIISGVGIFIFFLYKEPPQALAVEGQ